MVRRLVGLVLYGAGLLCGVDALEHQVADFAAVFFVLAAIGLSLSLRPVR